MAWGWAARWAAATYGSQRRATRRPDGADPQLDAEKVDGVGECQGGVEVAVGTGHAQVDRAVTVRVEEHEAGQRRELSSGGRARR